MPKPKIAEEPEVWIEYMRTNLAKDTFSRRSFADAIHRYQMMPDGCYVHSRTDYKTKETIWEYLM